MGIITILIFKFVYYDLNCPFYVLSMHKSNMYSNFISKYFLKRSRSKMTTIRKKIDFKFIYSFITVNTKIGY